MTPWRLKLRWTWRALVARFNAEWDLARMPVYDAARRRGLWLCRPRSPDSMRHPRGADVPDFSLAVRATRRVFRGRSAHDTCLVQALVLGDLLSKYEPALMIGIAHDAGGELFAHAWVEIDGRRLELMPRPRNIELIPLTEASLHDGLHGEVQARG